MPEVTNELIYGVLQELHTQFARLDSKLDEMIREMRSFRDQVSRFDREMTGVRQEFSR
jgi:hypothetical protein